MNYTCVIGTRLDLDLVLVAQNGDMLELHKTAASHSYQFADKWTERGYYNESNVILCVYSLTYL